ncbi:MBL fold metallo-hydrolase [Pseudohoeflea coraliihabitans]|uniref:MBL fold metallo-hydrolase n=1 Tax=Pseudohoeflea coraliihabitans TaxID=2860393 RepID=A0ABS6WLA9_9HYPH|nr:MBL fold metallo-hydrolase [Pseudohoeflea sp. DP4N28-3]MBW3096722.1 MBL fold metallo-hydrolase [Pseudohoeflea sp. DP4N28-3]
MAAGRNPYYSGPKSAHFDGQRFYNPEGAGPKGLRDLLRWQLTEKRARWPRQLANGEPPPAPLPRIAADDLRVTMIGHATLLIQTAGLNILTDPVWSDRVSPLSFLGPTRRRLPGIAFNKLPPIDLVLLTHNHYDHLDLNTLARLKAKHDPQVITPLGNETIIAAKVPDMRVATGDWDDTVHCGPLTVHFEPCHHWSARGIRDRSMALWSAFTLETATRRVFHVGDTGFDNGRPYQRARAKHERFDLAILPIGAFEPRWFMRDQHQNPEEALAGLKILGCPFALGHHWGTFQLTSEAVNEPVERLEKALSSDSRGSVAAAMQRQFRTLLPGEAWDVPLSSGRD